MAEKNKDSRTPHKPEPPARYVVWDSTAEKLGEFLDAAEGLLIKSRRNSGWIGCMERTVALAAQARIADFG